MRSEACDPSQEEPNIELEIASYINTHLQAQTEFFLYTNERIPIRLKKSLQRVYTIYCVELKYTTRT